MTNDIDKKQKIYQEWIDEARRIDTKKRPDEISSRDFARDAKIGRDLAITILEEKVKMGLASKRVTAKGTTFYTLI